MTYHIFYLEMAAFGRGIMEVVAEQALSQPSRQTIQDVWYNRLLGARQPSLAQSHGSQISK